MPVSGSGGCSADTPETAFKGTCGNVRQGIPLMWRDRWWGMFDRNPITTWVYGRIAGHSHS